VDKGKGAGGAARTNRVKAEILENLARVYRAQGRPAEAEEAQAKAAILWAIQ
jgi:tetratricopeptide repeat protein